MHLSNAYTKDNKDDGVIYVGDFVNGLEHGHGVLTDAEGKRSEGNFIEGKKDGEFIEIDVDGKETKTVYVKGRRR